MNENTQCNTTNGTGSLTMLFDGRNPARLADALKNPWMRDACLIHALGVQDEGTLDAIAHDRYPNTGQVVAGILDGYLMSAGGAPDPERVSRHIRALLACGDETAGAMACAAWLSWATGDLAHAAEYANKAQRADASLTMPSIVWAYIRHDVRPAYREDED